MAPIRLRTKLVLSLIITTAVLTGVSLLSVQGYLADRANNEIRQQILRSFESFEQYAELRNQLLRQATVVSADLPTLRALMSSRDPLTIQDASADFWRFTESDLFLLADPDGRVMALHSTSDFSHDIARRALSESLRKQRPRDWWFGGDRLYEVFLQPIYIGRPEDGVVLGILTAGFAVDDDLAAEVARVTSSEIAFRYGQDVVGSSLPADQVRSLPAARSDENTSSDPPGRIRLGEENFIGASVALSPEGIQPVTLTVLESYDAATLFLSDVNRRLLGVGLAALIAGSLMMFLISHTLTRPLSRLASGVVALEGGDVSYPLNLRRRDEVGELMVAFDTMRKSLGKHQQDLVHAERLATIGQMASTISHDLRHPLTTILAYAELLSERNVDENERREIYRQICSSVNNMADLIASLLEFSKAQEALRLAHGDCFDTLQDEIRTVRLRPEFQGIELTLMHEGQTEGWFDFPKLGRALHNLLRNACEAVASNGCVRVEVSGFDGRVVISISDDGPGIPEEIRENLFLPFVTFGKGDGTGLGLAVVEKVVRAHGGDVTAASNGSRGATFTLTLPLVPAPGITST